MAMVPMRERIVEVEADLGKERSPRYRYGSGLLIGDRRVLTAAHVVVGAAGITVRGPDKHPRVAKLDTALVGDPDRLDLALLEVPDAKDLPKIDVAVVNRNAVGGEIVENCWGVGYPEFMEVRRESSGRSLRETKEVYGSIAPLSGLVEGLLSLEVTSEPRPLPSGSLDRSEWSGMSGAAVFAENYLVGVVAEHAPRRGSSDITLTPLDLLLNPATAPPDAGSWLARLGIDDPRRVTILQGVRRGLAVVNSLPYADEQLAPVLPLRRERFASLLARHQLFSGRYEVMATLDAVAEGPGGDYVFVTGLSGYGKTAVLANWITRRRNAGATPCYSFVSRVDGTEDEEFTLGNLCEQLLLVHQRRAPLEPPRDWRSLYVELLQTPPPSGTRAVVVIDALDEADGWIGPDLFPPLPSGVSVIVSAREMATREWLVELGLPAQTTILALDRLGNEEIRELLAQTGDAARMVLSDPAATAAIVDVSRGDPYYVRLLADDMRSEGPPSVAELRARPRGLAAYFDRWWRDLVASGSEPAVRELLGYLLIARGPLARRELIDLDASDSLDDWSFDDAIAGIERHVVGDATNGYVIGHDRFRQYLLGDRIGTPAQRTARDRLLAHCRRWADNGSAYALQHLPGHLRDEGLSEELATLVASPGWLRAHVAKDPSGASFLDGVRTAWRDAEAAASADAAAHRTGQWVGHELGCALAVTSIRSVLVGLPAELLRQLLIRGRWSEDAVLAALREIPKPHTAATVLASLAPDLSPEGARAALAVSASLPDRHNEGMDTYAPRAVALAALAPRLRGATQSETIAAVFSGRARTDDTAWRRVLGDAPEFVALLSEERLREALIVAAHSQNRDLVAALVQRLHEVAGESATVAAISALDDADAQVTAISSVAPWLSPAGVREAFALAIKLSPGSSEDSPRARALHGLAPALDADLAAKALDAISEVPARGLRTCASVLLAARLDDDQRDERLASAVTAARQVDDPGFRTTALWDVLSVLDDAPADLVSDALDAAIEASRFDALTVFAPVLDVAGAERVVAALERDPRSVPPEVAVTVVGRFPSDDRAAAAHRILAAAEAYEGTYPADRPSALIAGLTAFLPADESARILHDELDRVRRHAASADALTEIARVAPDSLWSTVLDTAAAIDPRWRAATLTDLLEIAPASRRDEVIQHALDAARAIPARDSDGSPARGKALTALIAAVGEDRREALVDEALTAAQTIDDAALLVHAESGLLDTLNEEAARRVVDRLATLTPSPAVKAALVTMAGSRHASARRRAVEIAASLDEPEARLSALTDLARALPIDEVATVSEPFESAAEAVGDDALAAVAEHAPTPLLSAVLSAVESRPHSDALAFLATTLVRRLEGPVQERAFHWALTFRGERPAEELRPALRAWILERVADALPSNLAAEAVEAAQEMRDPVSVYPTMASLAASLSAETRPSLVAFMKQIIDIQPVAGARVALARPVLRATEPGAERDGLVQIVLDGLPADDPAKAAGDLASIAPYADGELAREALNRARTLSHPAARAYASASLLGHVGDADRNAVLDDVLRDIRDCGDDAVRCECLARVAAVVPLDRRAALVCEALAVAWEYGDPGVSLVQAALLIAPLDDTSSAELVVRVLHDALAVGTEKDTPVNRAASNGEQLPGLNAEWYRLLPDAPSLTITHPDIVALVEGDSIIEVYRRRVEQLPSSAMVAAIELGLRTLRRAQFDAWAGAVTELLPRLPLSPGTLERVVDELGASVDQAVTLEVLAPPLPTHLWARSSEYRAEKEQSRFVRAVGILAPQLAQLDHEVRHAAWREFLAAVSVQTRPLMLVDIRQAAAMMVSLSDDAGIKAALEGLERVGTSWP